MNENLETVIAAISKDLQQQKIRYGSCTVELVYHDGRITHYFFNTSVRKNIASQSQQRK